MKSPLVFLTDCYGGRGGIAQYNRNLIKALSESKSVKNIIIFQRTSSYKFEKVPKKTKLIKNINNSKIKFLIKVILFLFLKNKHDLVICNHIHLIPFAWLHSLKNNCPLLLFIFGEEAWNPTKHIISNYLCRKVKYFCAIRHYTAKKFISWSKIKNYKYFYIPNCIDHHKFNQISINKKIENQYKLKKKKIIISCARLDEEDQYKGVDEIIEVLGDLSQSVKNIIYIIIGDGNDKKRLQKKAKDLKVDNLVLFLGNVDEKTKINFLNIGHILASSGSRKTFDRYPYRFSNLEGLASGMHVLCSKLIYKSDLKDKNINMLTQVDPSNKNQLKKKIKYLLNKKKYKKQNLKNFYFSKFKEKINKIPL